MIRIFLFLCLLSSFCCHSQFMQEYDSVPVQKDTASYTKNVNYTEKRSFTENIREKYSGKDFEYIEEEEESIEEKSALSGSSFFTSLVFFVSQIFPYVLGLLVIIIMLKAFLGVDLNFWKTKHKNTKLAATLIQEDEDIHQTDLESLLQKAITQKEYRHAVRYYYLIVLKQLSIANHINYHKEKTNSEYLLEIENEEIRQQFSYLSYVFTYVWYGEFSINEADFKSVQAKYKSFKTNIK